MTPAIRQLKKAKIKHQVYEYEHDPRAESYGTEAADVMGFNPAQVFKTLLAELDDGRLVVAMVPVSGQLDLKALAKAAGARKAQMAPVEAAERATGYRVGGISPLGQKKRLAKWLDQSAAQFDLIYVSGGRRGLELALAPDDLCQQAQAQWADIARL